MIIKEYKDLRTYTLFCIGAESDQRISKKGITPNILHKSTNTIEELNNIFDKSVILCELCKDEFQIETILVHISRSKLCKSHYGTSYEIIKQLMEKYKLPEKIYEYAASTKQKKELRK